MYGKPRKPGQLGKINGKKKLRYDIDDENSAHTIAQAECDDINFDSASRSRANVVRSEVMINAHSFLGERIASLEPSLRPNTYATGRLVTDIDYYPMEVQDNTPCNPVTGVYLPFNEWIKREELERVRFYARPELAYEEPHAANTEANLFLEEAKVEQEYNTQYSADVLDLVRFYNNPEQRPGVTPYDIISDWLKLSQMFMSLLDMVKDMYMFLAKSSTHAFDFMIAALKWVTASLQDGWNLFLAFDKLMLSISLPATGSIASLTAFFTELSVSLSALMATITVGESDNVLVNVIKNIMTYFKVTFPPLWAKFADGWNQLMVVVTAISEFLGTTFYTSMSDWISASIEPMQIILPFFFSMFTIYFDIDGYKLLDDFHERFPSPDILGQLISIIGGPTNFTSLMLTYFGRRAWIAYHYLYDLFVDQLLGFFMYHVGLNLPTLTWIDPPEDIYPVFRSTTNVKTFGIVDGEILDQESCLPSTPNLAMELRYVPDHVAVIIKYRRYAVLPPKYEDCIPCTEPRVQQYWAHQQPPRRMVPAQDSDLLKLYQVRMETYEHYRKRYETAEFNKLIDEATDCITWCIELGIPVITIYQDDGRLIGEHDLLARLTSQKIGDRQGQSLVLSSKFQIRLFSPSINVVTTFNRELCKTEEAWNQFEPPPRLEDGHQGLLVILLKRNPSNIHSIVHFTRHYSEAAAQPYDPAIANLNAENETIPDLFNVLTGSPYNPSLLILANDKGASDGFPLYSMKQTLIYRCLHPSKPTFRESFFSGLRAYSEDILLTSRAAKVRGSSHSHAGAQSLSGSTRLNSRKKHGREQHRQEKEEKRERSSSSRPSSSSSKKISKLHQEECEPEKPAAEPKSKQLKKRTKHRSGSGNSTFSERSMTAEAAERLAQGAESIKAADESLNTYLTTKAWSDAENAEHELRFGEDSYC